MPKSKTSRSKVKKNTQSKPVGKNAGFLKTNKRKALFVVAIFALIGVTALVRSMAAPALWMPTADKPLTLTWILAADIKGKTPEQVLNLQTKDLKGNPIHQADVYDIDGENATKAQVDYLHSKGKKVICYFDAGVYEDYRGDANKFPKSVIGNPDEGWDGSWWLDIRQIDILEPIMKARIQMCKDKGFDSIEPDEITNWSNNPGFPITYNDQIKYNRAIAQWAHEAGLSIGLKGDLEQAHDLVNDFDWALIEECYQYGECTKIANEGPGADGKEHPGVQLFVQKNKAVWIAEYKKIDQFNKFCEDSKKNKFNTAWYVLGLPINSGRTDCPPFATNPNPPVTNPSVSIQSSSANPTAPANFTLTATSSLAAKIEISINDSVIKTCDNATSCSHSLSNYQAGTYKFVAEATTTQGGSGSSNTTVVVKSGTQPPVNKPPTVKLSTPNNTTFTEPASFSISAEAADSDGSVSSVQFYKNGQAVGAAITKSPYTLKLNNYQKGTYKFTAKATDNTGASSSESNEIAIVVNEKQLADDDGYLPSLPGTPVLTGSRLSYDWWKGACSWRSNCSLTIGWKPINNASGYEIRRNGQVIGTTATASFTEKPVSAGYSFNYEIYAKNSAGYSAKPAKADKTISCIWIFCATN